VGVRGRRFGAAAAVGDGAGVGARRARADAERAALVHPRDGAAAGADRVDVDHRNADRVVADGDVRRDERLAALDERDVAGRAAHVHRDDVLDAAAFGDVGGTLDTAGGPREERVHRASARGVGGDEAAVGLHDLQFRAHVVVADLGLEVADVAVHDGFERGVQRRRQRSLVLANFREHVAGQRVGDVESRLAEQFGDALLVVAVLEGEQQRDSDAVDVRVGDGVGEVAGVALVEFAEHVPALVEAAGNLEAAVAGTMGAGFSASKS